jgi:hypothetical protein
VCDESEMRVEDAAEQKLGAGVKDDCLDRQEVLESSNVER